MRAVKGIIKLAVIAVILIAIYVGFIGDFFLKTDNMVYEALDLPKSFVGYKIAHVSDVYNSSGFASAVLRADPDIVIISGNISGNNGGYDKAVREINKIAQSAKTYYVFGESDDENARANMRSSLNAIELTDTVFDLDTPDIDIQQFIEEVYGSNLYEKADKGDETSKAYIEYLNETINNEKNGESRVVLMGLGTYSLDDTDTAVNDLYDLFVGNEDKYKICAASQCIMFTDISKTGVNLILSGDTQSREVSVLYKDGVYSSNESTMIVSPGVANSSKYRRPIGGHRKVQIITLSDGSVRKMNPLEKFLNNIMGDVGTDFDNDGGFQRYRYSYDSYGNET